MKYFNPHIFANIFRNKKANQAKKGIAVLAMVIVVVSILALISISIATTSFFEVLSGASEIKSEEALRVAEAGTQDALAQLSKDIDFLCTGSGASCTVTANCTVDSGTDGYSLVVGGGTACIRVSNPASCPDAAQTIKVRGVVNNKIRKIQITYDLDCNGAITQTAWTELTS
ncbi:MAG: hypothetical protein UU22_C0004G0003 [Parcubacteria group bacterium GW2011_GWA2_40_8]|nr:MAG: hypothetical protein UU22_C0004G0003 [Parcubacteria group bacterium GW2011_GWA2_40_8]